MDLELHMVVTHRVGAGNWTPGPLQEPYALLATEPPLPPPYSSYSFYKHPILCVQFPTEVLFLFCF